MTPIDPTDVLLALLGGGFTLLGIFWTVRGNRQVKKLDADAGAYTRASEIDKGVHERVVEERDYFRGQLAEEREGRAADAERHASEKAELRGEIAELERRLREEVEAGVEREARLRTLLDEVVALRSRHDESERPRA